MTRSLPPLSAAMAADPGDRWQTRAEVTFIHIVATESAGQNYHCIEFQLK